MELRTYNRKKVILEWTTSLDTSSRTLFVREDLCRDVHVTLNVELRRARNLWYFGSKCYHVFSFATGILMW